MSSNDRSPMGRRPAHGQIGYLQLPSLDIARSAAFYQAVFGWSVDLEYGSFEAPGMIGQWTTQRAPTATTGPVLWICADHWRREQPPGRSDTAFTGGCAGTTSTDGSPRLLISSVVAVSR
jgi:catechol 2,3-dioxygenase-like lactoylglutathione lyase family enzyme